MITTKKNLDKLKANLPSNFSAVVSERTGCSNFTVYKVLAGQSSNIDVFKALVALAKEEKIIMEELEQQIESL